MDPSQLLDLKTVVVQDKLFEECYGRLKQIAQLLIQQVESYSLRLLPFVKIYKENITQSKLSEDTIELDVFRELILKHQQQYFSYPGTCSSTPSSPRPT